MKKILPLTLTAVLFNSCAFIFYNYQGKLDTEYKIANTTKDTNTKIAIGKLILNLSENKHFYTRKVNPTFDSIFLYGPDYHTFKIKLQEINDTINIHLKYVGYHGFRSRPPHKLFIQSLSDTLINNFKASQTININISNEKK
jgi:hypothetical protein